MQGRARVLGVGREGIEQAEERTSQIVWGEGEEFKDKAASQAWVDRGLSIPLGLTFSWRSQTGRRSPGRGGCTSHPSPPSRGKLRPERLKGVKRRTPVLHNDPLPARTRARQQL